MRKLIGALIFVFVLYVVYYDLSHGTLADPTSIILVDHGPITKADVENEVGDQDELEVQKEYMMNDEELPFKEVKVTAGQTVLSVVEQIHDGPLPVSISQLVSDFQLLNPNTEPEKIQIGKVYKFPVYSAEE